MGSAAVRRDKTLMEVYNRMLSSKIASSILLTGVVASFIYVFFTVSYLHPLRWYLTGGILLAYFTYFVLLDKVFAFFSRDRDLSAYDTFVISSALFTALRNGESLEESLEYASRFAENEVVKRSILHSARKIKDGVPVDLALSDIKMLTVLPVLLSTYNSDKLMDQLDKVADSFYSRAYRSASTGLTVFASIILPVLVGVAILLVAI